MLTNRWEAALPRTTLTSPDGTPAAPSRGELVADALRTGPSRALAPRPHSVLNPFSPLTPVAPRPPPRSSTHAPHFFSAELKAWLDELRDRAHVYPGFSLLAMELPGAGVAAPVRVWSMNNSAADATAAVELPPGYYGLSNAVLDTPWPKLVHGKQRFREIIEVCAPRPTPLRPRTSRLTQRSVRDKCIQAATDEDTLISDLLGLLQYVPLIPPPWAPSHPPVLTTLSAIRAGLGTARRSRPRRGPKRPTRPSLSTTSSTSATTVRALAEDSTRRSGLGTHASTLL